MNIVVLTVNHVYANKLVKDLLNKYGGDVKLIIEPSVLLQNKSTVEALLYYIKTSGFPYVVIQIIKLEIFRSLSIICSKFGRDTSNKFYSYRELMKKSNTKLETFENINSKEALNAIKKVKPDLIVSVLFSQILHDEVIGLAKKGVLNIHPAYLPSYRGISPIFWSLVNREKTSGISVHYIDKGIDTGKILKRKRVEIRKDDTEDSLYWRCVNVGSPLLISAIDAAGKGKVKTFPNKGGSYFSFPKKEAVRKYLKDGKKFFNLVDYLFT